MSDTPDKPTVTVKKTPEQWRELLTEMQFYVTRQAGTERAFTGELWDHKAPGAYHCVCCDQELFTSSTKYASGCGWPSFTQEAHEGTILYIEDRSHGMRRTEVRCARCDAHLGHVFPDGPPPLGTRFCINSASLRFEPG